jgi:hypothetical protein
MRDKKTNIKAMIGRPSSKNNFDSRVTVLIMKPMPIS